MAYLALKSTSPIQNLLILTFVGFMALFLQASIIIQSFVCTDLLRSRRQENTKTLAITLTIFSAIAIISASIYEILVQNNLLNEYRLASGMILSLAVLGGLYIIAERMLFLKRNRKSSSREQKRHYSPWHTPCNQKAQENHSEITAARYTILIRNQKRMIGRLAVNVNAFLHSPNITALK